LRVSASRMRVRVPSSARRNVRPWQQTKQRRLKLRSSELQDVDKSVLIQEGALFSGENLLSPRYANGVVAIVGAELSKDASCVRLDGLFGEQETPSNLSARKP